MVVGYFVGHLPRVRARAALGAENRELAIPTVSVVAPSAPKSTGGMILPAEIKPWIEAPIHARASGYLKRWVVDLGAEVKAGDLMAEIDTPELDQELARARAGVAEAEAGLTLARTTAQRWLELLKTSSVSEQETAEKQADLALKEASVEGAKANWSRLNELKGFARVTAPFAGVVSSRKVDVGDLVVAGSGKELFRLSQIQTLRVFVHVPQTVARATPVGTAAMVLGSDAGGRPVPAKVVRTAGVLVPETRTMLVELELDNTRREWVAGAFARVRFPDVQTDPRVTIPSNALLFRPEGPQVAVVGSGDVVTLRNLGLGRDFGPYLEVLTGLELNERVVLNPPDSLMSGVRVRVSMPATSPSGGGKP